MANTLSGCVDAGLLMFALRKKLGRLEWQAVRVQLRWLLCAGAAAGVVAWGLVAWWTEQFGNETLGTRLGAVFVPMCLASAVYLGLGIWLRVPFVKDLMAMVRGRLVKGAAADV